MPRPKSVDFYEPAGTTWNYVVKFPEGLDFTDGDILRIVIDKDWQTTPEDAEIYLSSDDPGEAISVPVDHVNWVNIHYLVPEDINIKTPRFIRVDYIAASGSISPVLRGRFEVGP